MCFEICLGEAYNLKGYLRSNYDDENVKHK